MSNTYLHKLKALFMKDVIEEIPRKLKDHFDRHNCDRGEFRKAKKDLQDRIAEKELKQQLKDKTVGF